MNYKICDWQGNNCAAANQFSYIFAFATYAGDWYFLDGTGSVQTGLDGQGPGRFPPYGIFTGGPGVVVD